MPIMQMVGILIGNTFCYFDVFNTMRLIITYLLGGNFIHIILFYIASYTFKFCNWYRYIITCNLFTITIVQYDLMIGIPISDKQLLLSYYIVATIFSLLAIYSKFHCYVKSN
jgi:hypothetical protein